MVSDVDGFSYRQFPMSTILARSWLAVNGPSPSLGADTQRLTRRLLLISVGLQSVNESDRIGGKI
jgi:hypothetical protein